MTLFRTAAQQGRDITDTFTAILTNPTPTVALHLTTPNPPPAKTPAQTTQTQPANQVQRYLSVGASFLNGGPLTKKFNILPKLATTS